LRHSIGRFLERHCSNETICFNGRVCYANQNWLAGSRISFGMCDFFSAINESPLTAHAHCGLVKLAVMNSPTLDFGESAKVPISGWSFDHG
jgi:hypothetical protein